MHPALMGEQKNEHLLNKGTAVFFLLLYIKEETLSQNPQVIPCISHWPELSLTSSLAVGKGKRVTMTD